MSQTESNTDNHYQHPFSSPKAFFNFCTQGFLAVICGLLFPYMLPVPLLKTRLQFGVRYLLLFLMGVLALRINSGVPVLESLILLVVCVGCAVSVSLLEKGHNPCQLAVGFWLGLLAFAIGGVLGWIYTQGLPFMEGFQALWEYFKTLFYNWLSLVYGGDAGKVDQLVQALFPPGIFGSVQDEAIYGVFGLIRLSVFVAFAWYLFMLYYAISLGRRDPERKSALKFTFGNFSWPFFYNWFVIFSGCIFVLGNKVSSAFAAQGLMVLLIPYEVQGLTILYAFFETKKVSGFLKAIGLFLSVIFLRGFLLVIGFFDQWIDSRSKFKQSLT